MSRDEISPERGRRFEQLRPGEIWEALAAFPCVYVASGPLEWHGLQNAIGLDALKAHALCLQAADRSGGLVFPPSFTQAHTVPWPLGMPVAPDLIERIARTVLPYLARTGARVVIWLSGHGGPEDYERIRRAALEAMDSSDCLIWAGVDNHLLADLDRPMDHAAAIETSLMQHLAPATVDLAALDPDPAVLPQGVSGDDPRTHANPEFGAERANLLIERLSSLAVRLDALGREDPVARRRHRECLAQQVELDRMVVSGRAHLPAEVRPSKSPPGWSEHLEAFRLGDYETAFETGKAVIDRARATNRGRL